MVTARFDPYKPYGIPMTSPMYGFHIGADRSSQSPLMRRTLYRAGRLTQKIPQIDLGHVESRLNDFKYFFELSSDLSSLILHVFRY
jgi:hypothetical protein